MKDIMFKIFKFQNFIFLNLFEFQNKIKKSGLGMKLTNKKSKKNIYFNIWIF